MICPTGEVKYFCKQDLDSPKQIEKSRQIALAAPGVMPGN
jgi:hypothetical protein